MAEAMACRTLVKIFTAWVSLILLLTAVSGCAPRSPDGDASSEEMIDSTASLEENGGLPTYEWEPSTGEEIPSETRFGDGDYGKKEGLSDVEA